MANVWIHDVLWSEIFTNVRPLQVLTTRSVHTIYDRRRKDRHSRPDFIDHKNTLVIFVTSYNKFLTTCVRSHLNNFNGIITPVPKKQSTFNERLSLYTLPRIFPINLCSRLAWLYHNKFYDRTRFEPIFFGDCCCELTIDDSLCILPISTVITHRYEITSTHSLVSHRDPFPPGMPQFWRKLWRYSKGIKSW